MNNNRSKFLTFLSALVPGVGYMYLGLLRKGIEALLIYLLIKPIFYALGISFLSGILRFSIWIYTFFDTFNIASKMDKGQYVGDSDFIFGKVGKDNIDLGDLSGKKGGLINKNSWIIIGWLFIIAGIVAIINKTLIGNELYNLIRDLISVYFMPTVFIIAGVYLLYKNKKYL